MKRQKGKCEVNLTRILEKRGGLFEAVSEAKLQQPHSKQKK